MRKAKAELAEELCRVANSRFKLWLENKNLLEAPEDVVDVLENAPAVLVFVIALSVAPITAICGLIGSLGGVVGAGIGVIVGIIIEAVMVSQ